MHCGKKDIFTQENTFERKVAQNLKKKHVKQCYNKLKSSKIIKNKRREMYLNICIVLPTLKTYNLRLLEFWEI